MPHGSPRFFALRFLFRKNLAEKPKNALHMTAEHVLQDKRTWYASLAVLTVMVVLFILHSSLHWEAWVVAVLGLTVMMLVTYKGSPDKYLAETELSLLLFFVSLFVIIGGVEHSHFLGWIGHFVQPLVEHDMLTACLVLMWGSAVISAMIDNIPFTAAMIPIILGMSTNGIDVTPLWWSLAIGVGMGGNGSHLGSTANVFIVTLTERLALREDDPSLRITPGLWLRKGTPVMLVTLIVCSLAMWAFSVSLHRRFKNALTVAGAVSSAQEAAEIAVIVACIRSFACALFRYAFLLFGIKALFDLGALFLNIHIQMAVIRTLFNQQPHRAFASGTRRPLQRQIIHRMHISAVFYKIRHDMIMPFRGRFAQQIFFESMEVRTALMQQLQGFKLAVMRGNGRGCIQLEIHIRALIEICVDFFKSP